MSSTLMYLSSSRLYSIVTIYGMSAIVHMLKVIRETLENYKAALP